jgi:hypothetical protein
MLRQSELNKCFSLLTMQGHRRESALLKELEDVLLSCLPRDAARFEARGVRRIVRGGGGRRCDRRMLREGGGRWMEGGRTGRILWTATWRRARTAAIWTCARVRERWGIATRPALQAIVEVSLNQQREEAQQSAGCER